MKDNRYILKSQELLKEVRHNQKVDHVLQELADFDPDSLSKALNEDNKRKTFWINIYNASVQLSLKSDPSKYKNRLAFYGNKDIVIAKHQLSPNHIEHGILRKSKWVYGLGYVNKLFPNSFEKKMRVEQLDPRIHFALNCGALSCPPILFYTTEKIDEQLDLATKSFLQTHTRVADEKLFISKLFLYYRGDFGNRQAIIAFLIANGALESTTHFTTFQYDPYDWSLKLNNYL